MIVRSRLTMLLGVLIASLSGHAHAARGGPDAGGWSWVDSQEPGVAATVEVPAVMTPIMSPPLVDEAIYAVDLSFPFTLYGTTSSRVWLSTNGWISLRDPGLTTVPLNIPIPSLGIPDATAAWAWGNLELGLAQVGSNSRGDVIEVHYLHRGIDVWVEGYIEFLRAGAIAFYYTYTLPPPTGVLSIGIEDGSGTIGTQIVHNGTIAPGVDFTPPYALIFYPPSPLDCSSATEVLCEPSIAGTTLGGPATANNYSCDTVTRAGAERVYRFEQRRFGRFQAWLSNLGGRDLALYLVNSACHPGFACRTGGGTSIDIPNLDPGTYFLAIDGTSAVDDGDYTLTVRPADADCNKNGVSDTCDIVNGTSTDCNADGRPDDCGTCPVDVIFMLDTSGSMGPYFAPLCSAIAATEAQLATEGIDFTSQVWGITDNGSSCLTDNVRNRLGAVVPGSPAPPLDNLTSSESWGQAASIVAALYPWTPDAIRVVVPIGDEGPYNGTPVNDPGDDRNVVTHAIAVCVANQVIASPVTPDISNPANDRLAQDLAAGTGGTWSSTGVNMGDAIVNLVRDACSVFAPSADAGPDDDICSPATVRLDGSGSRPTCTAGGIEFHWLEGTNEPCGGWSTTPICDVSPTTTTIYTLEVRCVTSPTCVFKDTMQVSATLGPLPALASTPRICPGDAITLDASGTDPNGCTTGVEYQFSDGPNVLQIWSGIATHGPLVPATTTTYIVETRCGSCANSTTATVAVEARPSAQASGANLLCAGGATTLDGAGSSGCPGAVEYRWLDGATTICNWSTTSTCAVMPATATTYTLEVRCLGGICPSTTTYPVDVAPRPVARVTPDQNVCAPGPIQIDASASSTGGCPGGPLYEWWQGATLVQTASGVPTYTPPTTMPGTLSYTVVVSCAALPGCDDTVAVNVTVRDCSLSVHFELVKATRIDSGHVKIDWTTVSELGTVLFAVETATSRSGPFELVTTTPALGSGSSYTVTDQVEAGSGPLWYRVVEHTVDGRGDESPAVEAVTQGREAGGARARRRAGHR